MKTTVHKASPIRGESVMDLCIEATEPFPEDMPSLADATRLHDRNGQAIVTAMLACLPGGTVDAVLRHLLEHRASMLRVRWPGATVEVDQTGSAEMRELLHRLVAHEMGPCQLDHHGYCQTHSLHSPPCPVAAGRKLLGLDAEDAS